MKETASGRQKGFGIRGTKPRTSVTEESMMGRKRSAADSTTASYGVFPLSRCWRI